MLPAPYKIRNIDVNPGLVLAPMSGVTNAAFRRLIKRLNPGAVGLMVTEFISVEGLTRNSRRSQQMLRIYPEEHPIGIQIFGYDLDRMRDAALIAQDAGADLVDINCGCPAPKVVKKGGGCELMRQPEHLSKIFAAVRKAISVPLTMKMRSGWDEDSRNAIDIAHIAEAEGVEAITVHGRTRAQLYRGQADWQVVRKVAEAVKIPVCGSGDVVDYTSAIERLMPEDDNGPKIAGLFIGRAAIQNPLVFSEIMQKKSLQPGACRTRPTSEILKIMELFIELLLVDFAPQVCVGRLKQLSSQMCHGHAWRKDFCRAMTLAEQLDILRRVAESDGSQKPNPESTLSELLPPSQLLVESITSGV